jgi:hypothetical protein
LPPTDHHLIAEQQTQSTPVQVWAKQQWRQMGLEQVQGRNPPAGGVFATHQRHEARPGDGPVLQHPLRDRHQIGGNEGVGMQKAEQAAAGLPRTCIHLDRPAR